MGKVETVDVTMESQKSVLVVGDSFAGGTGDPQIAVYPSLLGDAMGWNVLLDAQGATGYVSNGSQATGGRKVGKRQRAIDRLDADAAQFNPDIILIDVGRNDLGVRPEIIENFVQQYFSRLRTIWPKKEIVVIVPSYVTPRVAENGVAFRKTLEAAASDYDLRLIDPVREGWYQGVNVDGLLGPDGVHLNAKGNIYYTNRIMESLRALGVHPGGGSSS
ncbi:SGNH/GDSL hydrolase family protein [Gordonia sp. NPDC003376]